METTRKVTKALFWGALGVLFTLIPVSQAVAQTCVQPPSGLVGWWDGDAVSGTTAFDIQNGNDGTLEGNATTAPGFVGNAFTFDGGGDRITGTLSGFAVGNSAITTSAWINQPMAVGHPGRGIVGVGDNTNQQHFFQRLSNGVGAIGPTFVCQNTDGTNRLCIGADKVSLDRWWASNTVINNNQWHYVATTYSGPPSNEVKIYIDGVLDRIIPLFADLALTNTFYIGGDGFNDNFFTGLIDEVQIYNRALTTPEIAAIFNAGNAGTCKPFVLSCLASDPIASIDDAISEINALVGLDPGTTQTLVQKLQEAEDKFNLGDLPDARSKVYTFVVELEAAVNAGKLTMEDADVLLNKAGAILAAMTFE